MAGTKPGPAPTRRLTAVRDGNPAKKPIREGVKLPPGHPAEPDWAEIYVSVPDDAERHAENLRCRRTARWHWRMWEAVLFAQGLIAEVDAQTLGDAACCVAELRMAQRDLARRGLSIETEHGRVRNPAVTAIAQFRTALKNYIANLGLAPAARVGLVASWDPGGVGGDEDDVFD